MADRKKTKLWFVFLFSGILYFVSNASLHSIAIYKQYQQVKMLQSATNLMRMQMEHFENYGVEDPYDRTL